MENKMVWTPWEWKEFTHFAPNEEPQGTTIMDCGGHYICHQFNIRPLEKRQEIAQTIISAVNGTYGIGINPAFVGELYLALTGLMEDIRNKPNDTRYNIHMKIAKDAIDKCKI